MDRTGCRDGASRAFRPHRNGGGFLGIRRQRKATELSGFRVTGAAIEEGQMGLNLMYGAGIALAIMVLVGAAVATSIAAYQLVSWK